MADSTVPCPSCGKQYRIREGSNPGTFICTACGGEVSYGAPARARPAQARPAGPPAQARRPRAASGAPKNLKRTRAASEKPTRRQREGAPPPKTNTGLYIGLGALVVVVVAAVVFVVMSTDDTPVKPTPNVANQNPGDGNTGTLGGTSGTPASTDPIVEPKRPAALIPDPEPEPGTEPVKEPGREKLDTRKGTVNDKETDPFKMGRMQLRSKSYKFFIEHLKHFDETPQDQRDMIDADCAKLVDFFAGGEATEAQDRLIEIGKPAIPRVILAFSQAGDLGSREGMINACVVSATLQRICGSSSKVDELKQFASPGKSEIMKVALYWCVWWFSTGHKMESFATDEGGDEEEEE